MFTCKYVTVVCGIALFSITLAMESYRCWNWSNNDSRRCTLGHTNKWSLYIPVSGRQPLALHTLSHRRWQQTVTHTHTYKCHIHTALHTHLALIFMSLCSSVFSLLVVLLGVHLKLFRPNLPATTLLFSLTVTRWNKPATFNQQGRKGNRRLVISCLPQDVLTLQRLKCVAAIICLAIIVSPNKARTLSPDRLIKMDCLTPSLKVLIKLWIKLHFPNLLLTFGADVNHAKLAGFKCVLAVLLPVIKLDLSSALIQTHLCQHPFREQHNPNSMWYRQKEASTYTETYTALHWIKHFLGRRVRRAHFIPMKFLKHTDAINESYLQPQTHQWPTQGPHYTN